MLEANPYIAYGATLLAVLATSEFILYFQLGDGDILAVTQSGDVSALLGDSQLALGDDTVSLCSPEAWRECRVRLEPVDKKDPALVLLSTDGYSKSFVDQAAFLQVGVDLYKMLTEEGIEIVKTNLPGWLNATSSAGSGDDITLAIVYRPDSQ